jgi:hypothetical protein
MPFKGKYKFVPELCLVAFLLSMHFFLAFTSLTQESATFDETVHITGGLSYWKFDDYRINPENGNLPQRLAAIPLLFEGKINLPVYTENPSIEANEWLTAYDFLYKKGNDPDRIFMLGKTMIVLLSLSLGLVVYFWSRKLFGPGGAAFSLILYAFCPTVLAHARLVTSDIAAALGFIASAWAVWHMLQRITVARLLLSSFCLSVLFLSKMSAPMIIPMYLIMIAMRLRDCPELEVVIPGRIFKLRTQSSQLSAFLLAGMINVIVIVFFIWMSFGFRYSMINDKIGGNEIMEQNWQEISRDTGLPGKVIDFSRQHRLLPEAYLFGFQFVLKKSEFRYSWLNGEYSLTGFRSFFPYACLVKTPLPLLGIFLTILFLSLKKIRKIPSGPIMAKLYPYTPLITLISVYAIFAVTSNMSIGHRHVLLLYPAAYILAGGGFALLKKASGHLKFAAGFFLLWFMAESFGIWPHYLAYFNQIAGGPKNGYRHLVDSSLDWGQDLKGLGKWLKSNGLLNQKKTEVYVSYFGIAGIDYYAPGVKKLPSYYGQEGEIPFELEGGIYCISATMLPLLYLPELLNPGNPENMDINENLYGRLDMEMKDFFKSMGNRQKFSEFMSAKGNQYWVSRYRLYQLLRFAKLAKYLETRNPDDNIGYSILIFKLTDAEVANALKAKL